MSGLILAVIFSLAFAFFATQNTGGVEVRLGNFLFSNIPIYLVAMGALLVGLLISWVINTVEWVVSATTIKSRESRIRDVENNNLKLQEQLQNLEVENAKLKGEKKEVIHREFGFHRPNFFERLRHNI